MYLILIKIVCDIMLMRSEFHGSGTIIDFRFSWGPSFGFDFGNRTQNQHIPGILSEL